MWLWNQLGLSGVTELPKATVEWLGRGCEAAEDVRASSAETHGHLQERIRGERGELFELADSAQPELTRGEWDGVRYSRLHVLSSGRNAVFMPRAVTVAAGTPTRVTGVEGLISPLPVRDAIRKLLAKGGGSFTFEAPMARCKLSPDALADLLATVPSSHVVSAVVLGAELRCSVAPAGAAHSQPAGASAHLQVGTGQKLPALAATPGRGEREKFIVVEGDGFQLRIVQRGGPPVDPRKLNGLRDEMLAKALDAWVRSWLSWSPMTWERLYVLTSERVPSPKRAAMAQSGETDPESTAELVATASVDLRIDPSEMGSHGAAHTESLKRIFEGDVAGILGIAAEQVMCGLVERGLPSLRRSAATKGEAVRLHFALLNSVLAQERRAPSHGLPGRGLPPLAAARGKQAATPGKQQMSKTLPCQWSLPELPGQKSLSGSIQSQRQLSRDASTPALANDGLSALERADKGQHPPTKLLSRLHKLTSASKLPAQVRAGAFPMLTRVRPHSLKVRECVVGVVDSPLGSLSAEQRQAPRVAVAPSVAEESLQGLSQARCLTASNLKSGFQGAVAAAREGIQDLKPRDLLVHLEASLAKQATVSACLEVLLERTADGQVKCKAHRVHGLVPMLFQSIGKMANARDGSGATSCVSILVNMAKFDLPGSLSDLTEGLLVLLDAMSKLIEEQLFQVFSCQLLERLFESARAAKRPNRRVITLGNELNEAFTFRIIKHMFIIMRLYQKEVTLQVEALNILAPQGDALMDGGLAAESFGYAHSAVRRHPRSVNVGIRVAQLMGRLGPAFLARERRSVQLIILCLHRHRSDAALQHAGAQALSRLCAGGGDSAGVRGCRASGAVSAMVLAICSHRSDQQLVREASRVLERLSPGGMAVITSLRSELSKLLAPMQWGVDPFRTAHESLFDLSRIKESGQFTLGTVNSFQEEVLARGHVGKRAGAEELSDSDMLLQFESYAAQALRDELSCPADKWPLPGRGAVIQPPNRGKFAQDLRERDMIALQSHDCDTSVFMLPGPERSHIVALCRVLKSAADVLPEDARQLREQAPVGAATTGAALAASATAAAVAAGVPADSLSQGSDGEDEDDEEEAEARRRRRKRRKPVLQLEDAECIITLLGHYAWSSVSLAREIFSECAGAAAIIQWLRAPCFSLHKSSSKDGTGGDWREVEAAIPMQHACLSSLAALCRHEPAGPSAIVAAGGAQAAVAFLGHMDARTRAAALRCMTRLLHHTSGGGGANQQQQNSSVEHVDPGAIWPVILAGLREMDNEVLRTAAGACAFAALSNGWAEIQEPPTAAVPLYQLVVALKGAIVQATRDSCGEALLPSLLSLRLLLSTCEINQTCFGAYTDVLVRALPVWLPAGRKQGSLAIERVVALACAEVLAKCYELELVPAAVELDTNNVLMILETSASDHVETALARACDAVLQKVVMHESETALLESLLAAPLKRSDGTERLPSLEVLDTIIGRMNSLLQKYPEQAGESLKTVLDRTEAMLLQDSLESSLAVLEKVRELKSFLKGDPRSRTRRRRHSSSAGRASPGAASRPVPLFSRSQSVQCFEVS